ncbi:MAG TPA: PAS domain S-box protein, partial [Prolixibacteraceae bacterium]|nr:PAS domain S-box protein [Prolixibacteraceae bacterium]
MNKPIRKRQVLLGNITNLLKNEELDETFFAELKQRVFETMQHFTEKNKKDMTNHGCSQLSVLMNHLPGMAYKSKKDESRTMLFVSSGCFKLTGYKPEELLNNNSISFGQLILSDDKSEIKKLDKISVGETFELEYRIFDRMGKERWCWEKGELVKDAYSGETFIEGFIADITDRKIAEKELSEHTAQLKKAQAIGKIGSWKISLDTNRVAASEESVRIYGFTPKKDYSLKEVQDVVLPEFRAKLNHVLYSLINLGNSYETEYKLRRPADGQIVDIRLVAEFNPKDNTVTGIIQDITERKNAESRMQENDAIFRSLIENSNDAIYILYNRKFELINSGFQKMLGYTDSDVKKPNFDPIYFIAEESLGFINERIEKLKKGEKVSNRYEFTAITKTGEKKEVEASVSYIPFRGGTATQGILRDVTERNRNEQKIKSLSELKSLLVGLSANFIHVPVNEINHSVKKSLMKLGQFVDADRAYVFEYNFADLYCRNTFEWCSIGTSAQIGNLQHVPIDYFPEWIEKHKNGEYVNVPDVSKVPNPEFRQMLQKQDIKSLLTLPLNNEGQCVGFVGFDSVEKLFCFSNDEIEILKIYAKMLGNSFERQQRELELIEAKERAEESDLLKSAFLANV